MASRQYHDINYTKLPLPAILLLLPSQYTHSSTPELKLTRFWKCFWKLESQFGKDALRLTWARFHHLDKTTHPSSGEASKARAMNSFDQLSAPIYFHLRTIHCWFLGERVQLLIQTLGNLNKKSCIFAHLYLPQLFHCEHLQSINRQPLGPIFHGLLNKLSFG